jgi:hypothetical protein
MPMQDRSKGSPVSDRRERSKVAGAEIEWHNENV